MSLSLSTLKPYPDYKPSSVEWLGDVPAHWEAPRLKASIVNVLDQNPQGDKHEIRLALEHVESWTGRYNDAAPDVRFDSQVKHFQADDVLFGKLRPYLAKVVRPDKAGRCVSEFLVLRPRNYGLSASYLELLLRSKLVIDAINSSTFGAKMPRTNWQFLGNMHQPLPTLHEQSAIVRYIDHVDERISRYITAKERLINLLEEQRQAVIQRTVTQGLDPNVRLKPSGVEWLGDMPAHWEVVALRYLATKFGSGVTPRGGATVYQNTGVPFLRSQNVHFDELRLEDVARITPRLHQTLSNTHVRPGDVLLNITGASIGRVCSVPDDFGEGNVSQHVCIIRPKKNRLLSGFLASYLSTTFMQREIRFEQNGASREGLTLDSIRNFKIVLPDISEQQDILTETRDQTGQLVAAVNAAQHEIELLKEYRTRLIADVVTGKLDVREAAFKLPEVSDDLSLSDTVEDVTHKKIVDDHAH